MRMRPEPETATTTRTRQEKKTGNRIPLLDDDTIRHDSKYVWFGLNWAAQHNTTQGGEVRVAVTVIRYKRPCLRVQFSLREQSIA